MSAWSSGEEGLSWASETELIRRDRKEDVTWSRSPCWDKFASGVLFICGSIGVNKDSFDPIQGDWEIAENGMNWLKCMTGDW